MVRTQVYLGERELELLNSLGRATGVLRQSAGVWKDRAFTRGEYVDMIRGDLNARLRRLGFD